MKAFPTSLDTFRNCPRKYAFDRDPAIKAEYRKPTEALYVGMCVHDALEVFFNDVPPPRRDYDTLVYLLRKAWAGKLARGRRAAQRREERAQVFGDDREAEAMAGEKAKHMLWGFCQTQDLTIQPYTSEGFHEIPLGETHILAGKIDRVDRLEDGRLRVVDYKTGKSKTADRLRQDDIQLAAYGLIVARKFGAPLAELAMIYLKDTAWVGFEPDEAWLAEKERELLDLLDRIEAETARPDGPDKFAPTPNVLCGWCDYRPLCPEGRAYLDERGQGEVTDDEALPF